MDTNNKLIVGLTGGIASGKSLVSEYFSLKNFHIVDADLISKKVTAPGTYGHDQLLEAFPSVAVEGVISRLKLRKLVFENYTELKKLSAIVQPLIALEAKIELEKAPNGVVIFVVPLLFEAGFDNAVNLTVTVSCNDDVRIQRLIQRDNIDKALATQILSSQMSDKERESHADYVIKNEGTTSQLKERVDELSQIFVAKVTNN